MRGARKKLRLCSQARVVGVAFFDFKHGQTERRPERDRTASDIQLRLPLRLGRPGGEPERPGRYRATAMLYDVLVISNGGGGKRFTTERDAPLSVGDTFEQDAESYRVLAIQTGHGPFDYVIEAEGLASSGPSEVA